MTDKIIVRFVPKATNEQIEQILEKYSLSILKEYKSEPNTYLVKVSATSGENPIKIANKMAEEKLTVFAEPNMVNRFQTASSSSLGPPSDEYFERQWHLNAKTAPQLVAEASVKALDAWKITTGKRTIVVAVIDDGFDIHHPDFTGLVKVVFPKDYVDGDSNPLPERGDYHGTPCAGVAIAESNGQGVVGRYCS